MDKPIAPAKGALPKGKKGSAGPVAEETLIINADSGVPSLLARTDEFTMPSDDAAGDFLLDKETDETVEPAVKPKAKLAKAKVAAQPTLASGEAKSKTAETAGKAKPPEQAKIKKTSLAPEDAEEKMFFLGETQDIHAPSKEAAPPPTMESTQHMSENQAPPPPDSMKPAAKSPAGKASVKPGDPAKAADPVKAKSTKQSGKATIIGDYKLLKKLGQGGMGAVYKAFQTSLEREVALKILSRDLAAKPAFVQRFKREGIVMTKLDHPNILRSYDVGESLGFHYIAIEYVEGGSVENKLKELGRLEIGDALHIALAVARALQHAHELNLIHRDIKPDNILLTKNGVVKVADMGLAKATDDDMSLTKTGTGAGTPLFMAPEQARDVKHVDGRVDIYALGCMLYVLLTGEAPFRGETLVDLIEAKEKGKYTPVRQMNDEVPERLSLIIDKMMASKPEHRFKNCAEIVVEIEKFGLHNEHLSFFPRQGPMSAAARHATPPPPPRKVPGLSSKTSSPASASMVPKSLAQSMVPGEENLFYVKLVAPTGKSLVKKLTKDQVIALVKNKAINAESEVSRNEIGPFRALASFNEFAGLTRAQQTTANAQKKGEKFKTLYDKIEQQDASRRRWKWLNILLGRTGGFLSVILWLALLAGALVGAFFLFRFIMTDVVGGEMPF